MKKLFLIFVSMFTFAFGTIDSVYAVDYPFSLTTSSISSGGTFEFNLSAQGTFYVDCGTGGTLGSDNSTANAMISGGIINKTDTTKYTFKCTYSSAGTKTIRFGGAATAYNTSAYTSTIQFTSPTIVASISGNLSTIFPNLGADLGQHPVFYSTFYNCTNLTSIPDTLFSGYTTGVSYMFFFTFSSCTGLTSIPANLFSKITSGAKGMFYYTFSGCTSLTGTVPFTLFSGLIANGSPYEESMMNSIFLNAGLSTTCPSGKKLYKTGYEVDWSARVACGDPITCASGKYLPAGSTTCNALCPSGYTCPAGTVGFNAKADENKYAPIALTWDGVNTTPASCNVGETFVPSTPPSRTGYVFAGWRVSCASKIKNLDANIENFKYGYTSLNSNPGSYESNYGLKKGSGKWAMEFDYGTVWGMAKCSSTSGNNGSSTWPESSKSNWLKTPSNTKGRYCWCQVTGFTASGNSYTSGPQCTTTASSSWVFRIDLDGTSDCLIFCAWYCTSNYINFRAAMFGAAGQQ